MSNQSALRVRFKACRSSRKTPFSGGLAFHCLQRVHKHIGGGFLSSVVPQLCPFPFLSIFLPRTRPAIVPGNTGGKNVAVQR